MIQNALENANVEDDPDGPDDFVGIAELRAAVDKFNAANRDVVYWDQDGKRVVRINWAEVDAENAAILAQIEAERSAELAGEKG